MLEMHFLDMNMETIPESLFCDSNIEIEQVRYHRHYLQWSHGADVSLKIPNSGSSSAHSSIAPPRQEMSHKNKSFHLSNGVIGRSLRNTTNYNDKLYLLKHSDMLLIL